MSDLPDTAPATDRDVGPGGSARRDVGTTSPTLACLDVPVATDDGAALDVRGIWYDDEPGSVVIRGDVDGGRVEFTLDAPEARAFAEQVGEAARFAAEGD